MTVAALYVQTGGCYFGLPDVDPWDQARDARRYAGPWPVVAHPPCERYGRYWSGGPSAKVKRRMGDDDGCFAHALDAVRRWGGILEHPEGSHAWRMFGLMTPPREGRWVSAGLGDLGWTCCVEQGAYGHRARKATWLYACHVDLPALAWGRAPGEFLRLEEGFMSSEERRQARAAGVKPIRRIAGDELAATPIPFRDLLLGIARTARAPALEVAA